MLFELPGCVKRRKLAVNANRGLVGHRRSDKATLGQFAVDAPIIRDLAGKKFVLCSFCVFVLIYLQLNVSKANLRRWAAPKTPPMRIDQ